VSETEVENGGSFLDLEDDFEHGANEAFQTVLPMVEDLVIHFKGEKRDLTLAAMIQAFKDGTYPVSMPPPLAELNEDVERHSNPTTRRSTPRQTREDTPDNQNTIQESLSICHPGLDEYDPFAYVDSLRPPSTICPSKHGAGSRPQAKAIVSTPPTPAQTPTPSRADRPPEKAFHELDIKECQTAVCIQNSLRFILKIHFPSEDLGYHHFNPPLLAELSSLWQPVFREASSRGVTAKRKIDLLLAIGAEKGVDRKFLGAISGSLEKLGRKHHGTSRSGRIDLR
jgi:hypothetical protein